MLSSNNLFKRKVKADTRQNLDSFLKRFGDIWRGKTINNVDASTLHALRNRAWLFQIAVNLNFCA